MRIALLIIGALLSVHSTEAAESAPRISFHAITDEIQRKDYRPDLEPDAVHYAAEPWLTDADIVGWDASSGWIFLKGDKWRCLEKIEGAFDDKGYLASFYRLFLVRVDGRPCFIGQLHSVVSSIAPVFPSILDAELKRDPANCIILHARSWDPRLVQALEDLGLYRGGLEVDLKAARLVRSEDYPRAATDGSNAILRSSEF